MPGLPRIAICAFLSIVLFSSCGPVLQRPMVGSPQIEAERERQKEAAIRVFVTRQKQLSHIGSALKIAAAEFCGEKTAPLLGVAVTDIASVPAEYRKIAATLGIDDRPQISVVAKGSPAAEARLKEGDVVVQVGTNAIVSGAEAIKRIKENGYAPVNLKIITRDRGSTEIVTVTPAKACDVEIKLVQNDEVNAATDGNSIMVTSGLLRFATTDQEIAFVLSHEISHFALAHVDRAKGNQLVGGLLGLLLDIGIAAAGVNTGGAFMRAGAEAGAKAYSQEFEMEADYLSLYLLARANIHVEDAPEFFRRFAAEHPGTIAKSFNATHPSTPERTALMLEVIKEIREKIEKGEPIIPSRLPTSQPTRPEADESFDDKLN